MTEAARPHPDLGAPPANTRRRLLLAGLAALALLLVALPALRNLEVHPEPTGRLLPDPASHWIEGSHGRSHWIDEGRGPAVVLVHGLTGNFTVWDHTRPALRDRYRVLAVDLYGRGLSARPDVPHTAERFVEQIREGLDALEVTSAVLIGSSMGGAVVSHFAARYPERVRGLVLIASAGLLPSPPAMIAAVRPPGVGEALLAVLMPEIMAIGYRQMFYDPAVASPRMRERYGMSTRITGFRRSLLSTLRHFGFHDLAPVLARIEGAEIPVFLVWGQEDAIVPVDNYTRFRDQLPQARGIVVHEAGHLPHYERPELVHPQIRRFLDEVEPASAAPEQAP